MKIVVCRNLKGFILYGYKINPDHIHLLIRPGERNNYSEIMRSLKTNFSRNMNRVMNGCDSTVKTGPHTRRRGHACPPMGMTSPPGVYPTPVNEH